MPFMRTTASWSQKHAVQSSVPTLRLPAFTSILDINDLKELNADSSALPRSHRETSHASRSGVRSTHRHAGEWKEQKGICTLSNQRQVSRVSRRAESIASDASAIPYRKEVHHDPEWTELRDELEIEVLFELRAKKLEERYGQFLTSNHSEAVPKTRVAVSESVSPTYAVHSELSPSSLRDASVEPSNVSLWYEYPPSTGTPQVEETCRVRLGTLQTYSVTSDSPNVNPSHASTSEKSVRRWDDTHHDTSGNDGDGRIVIEDVSVKEWDETHSGRETTLRTQLFVSDTSIPDAMTPPLSQLEAPFLRNDYTPTDSSSDTSTSTCDLRWRIRDLQQKIFEEARKVSVTSETLQATPALVTAASEEKVREQSVLCSLKDPLCDSLNTKSHELEFDSAGISPIHTNISETSDTIWIHKGTSGAILEDFPSSSTGMRKPQGLPVVAWEPHNNALFHSEPKLSTLLATWILDVLPSACAEATSMQEIKTAFHHRFASRIQREWGSKYPPELVFDVTVSHALRPSSYPCQLQLALLRNTRHDQSENERKKVCIENLIELHFADLPTAIHRDPNNSEQVMNDTESSTYNVHIRKLFLSEALAPCFEVDNEVSCVQVKSPLTNPKQNCTVQESIMDQLIDIVLTDYVIQKRHSSVRQHT